MCREASRNIAKECAECIVEGQGLEVLLNFLEIDENESVRVAIAEALFFFIVRNEMGRLAVVIQRGVSTFANCLEIETSAVIRSYYCAILRELGSVYPEELLKEDMIHVCAPFFVVVVVVTCVPLPLFHKFAQAVHLHD